METGLNELLLDTSVEREASGAVARSEPGDSAPSKDGGGREQEEDGQDDEGQDGEMSPLIIQQSNDKAEPPTGHARTSSVGDEYDDVTNDRVSQTDDSASSTANDSSSDIADSAFNESQSATNGEEKASRSPAIVRPKETKKSQHRLKSRSVATDAISRQQKPNTLRRQASTPTDSRSEDPTEEDHRSSPSSRTPPGHGQNDARAGKEVHRRTSSSDQSNSSGSETSGKSREHINRVSSARQEFAETHHIFGIAGSQAKKTHQPPPPPPPPQQPPREQKQQQQQQQQTSKSKNFLHDCSPTTSPYGATEKYLTPLQQKEKQVKELNSHVSKLETLIMAQGDRIHNFEKEEEEDLDELRREKDEELGKLLVEIKKSQLMHRQTELDLDEVRLAQDKETQTVAALRQQIATMKTDQEEREAVHQQRYLEMYQKGREAQLIEQEEDLVCMAIASAPDRDASTRNLVKKLEKKEEELEKLRQTFREDVYSKSPLLDTDSAAQVEILKSAVYYYLTDRQPMVNLNAMLSMLNYSQVQKRNIVTHLKKSKSKSTE